ncbi:MAG: hypothetical protein GTN89_05270 [Acidobacteria bacterium]|nr:hypothetical protein [Acidobacteriota bacterium]NIM61138.1 hypothetical protein [Acidobacteriota bacterium]NIO58728.1 hypothetical protein [Acidobacteriota bacterium]NIQ29779.1 hypothetical protein [Acidobacteriota bacterium]NIQ84499.1 hypothetical protein [Acidobacteriota bacterium]
MRKPVFALLITLALVLPAAASDTKDEDGPKTRLQKLMQAIDKINAQALNAGTKLRLGAKSVDTAAVPGERPPTPARICCGANIDKIAKEFNHVAMNAKALLACYQARGEADQEVALNFFREDASAVYTAMEEFTGAGKEEEAQAGYAKVAQAILDMHKSAKELQECDSP